jgi:hypothetical protein
LPSDSSRAAHTSSASHPWTLRIVMTARWAGGRPAIASIAARIESCSWRTCSGCEGCVWYVDQIRTTIEALGRIEPEEVPPQVRAQLLTAFRDWTRS